MCNIWQGEFPRVNTAEDGYPEGQNIRQRRRGCQLCGPRPEWTASGGLCLREDEERGLRAKGDRGPLSLNAVSPKLISSPDRTRSIRWKKTCGCRPTTRRRQVFRRSRFWNCARISYQAMQRSELRAGFADAWRRLRPFPGGRNPIFDYRLVALSSELGVIALKTVGSVVAEPHQIREAREHLEEFAAGCFVAVESQSKSEHGWIVAEGKQLIFGALLAPRRSSECPGQQCDSSDSFGHLPPIAPHSPWLPCGGFRPSHPACSRYRGFLRR